MRCIIVEQAANFFFEEHTNWTSVNEVRLCDANGRSAGNIDMVLVAYNQDGEVMDFGSIEIQAVYISGNIRTPFRHFMKKPDQTDLKWQIKSNYPKPDYLSSSRKRLIPQVLHKGGILKDWNKKQAVVLQNRFFETLPKMPETRKNKADIAWFLYDLTYDKNAHTYKLTSDKVVYTEFEPALKKIVTPSPGKLENFLDILQKKLDAKFDGHPPDAPSWNDRIIQ